MTRRMRIRRVAILCCHCLRNIAFYMAGWQHGEFIPKKPSQFWKNVNANFMDICVLSGISSAEEKRGKHYWGKVITDHASFFDGLINVLGMTKDDFALYIDEIRSYRDKFIAHLDSNERMHIQSC